MHATNKEIKEGVEFRISLREKMRNPMVRKERIKVRADRVLYIYYVNA
jgi:hypothetical protein